MKHEICGAWDCAKCGEQSAKEAFNRAQRSGLELAAEILKERLDDTPGDKWEVLEKLVTLESAALLVAGCAAATAISLTGAPPKALKQMKKKALKACVTNFEIGMKAPLKFSQLAAGTVSADATKH